MTRGRASPCPRNEFSGVGIKATACECVSFRNSREYQVLSGAR